MTAGLLWNRNNFSQHRLGSFGVVALVLEIGIPWNAQNFKAGEPPKKKEPLTFHYIYAGSLTFFNIGILILIIPISLGCIKPQTNQRPLSLHCSGSHKNLLLPHKSLLRCQLGGQLLLGALQWVAEVLFFLSSAWWTPEWRQNTWGFCWLTIPWHKTIVNILYNLLFINQIRANGWRLWIYLEKFPRCTELVSTDPNPASTVVTLTTQAFEVFLEASALKCSWGGWFQVILANLMMKATMEGIFYGFLKKKYNHTGSYNEITSQ